MNLWIKICGNTSLADAQLAAEAGADAVGFVFAPSPRRVTAGQVAEIVPHLPPALEKIGVFVDAALEEIAAAVEGAGLTGVQLHFDAAPELPARLRERFGPGLRILRVVHFDAQQTAGETGFVPGHDFGRADDAKGNVKGHDFSRAEDTKETERALAPGGCFSDPNIDAILVDSRTFAAAGGTGLTYDWNAARRSIFDSAGPMKLIAAGGLTPENVAEAIATLRPWGVDVVSGVESAPGRKDAAKVQAFIATVRAAQKLSEGKIGS
jgi:phosphoribosylanthranilate isomerase